MTRFVALCALLLMAASLCGCPAEPPPAPAPTPEEPTATPVGEASAEAPVYDVICGCKVPDVKRCGDYAVVEGKHVKINGLNMGAMPFCGKTGLKARIDGSVVDGKLQATGFTYVK